ncbi:hypothetical protein ABW21_db0208170 [Orbilia brochopaga]|nr:hypothetical protein ABW21_db0208170 [Drechslerella brochopaga]
MKSAFAAAFVLLPLAVVNAGVIPRQTAVSWISTTDGVESAGLTPGYNYGMNGDLLWVNFHTIAGCGPVEVHWAVENAWAKTPMVAEKPTEPKTSDGGSYWLLTGNATSATQFFVKATCGGKEVYAPGNGQNYQIPPPPAPIVPKIIGESYGINGNHLWGEFRVPYNCEAVNIFWAKGSEFQETPVAAELRSPAIESYYATWGVEAETPGATQFYIKATCGDKELISPGNFVNYQLKA